MALWMARAPRTASPARAKATKNASPWVSISRPLCEAKAERSRVRLGCDEFGVGRIAEALDELSRLHDVREEEGDRSGRQVPHGTAHLGAAIVTATSLMP